jgi:tetratricopeptide (TPR) repeat protein
MWPPRWSRRKSVVRIVIPAAGAVLLGGVGWLLGPLWTIAGIVVGPVAALAVLLIIFARAKPKPVLLMRSGRPQEAYRQLQYELSYTRGLARRRPMFRDVLAGQLETMSQVLQALGNEPKALETVTEAVAIFSDLTGKRPGRYATALARTLLQQAALLAHMARHGEALAAIDPAVQIYRRLSIKDRNAYLPSLAAALTRQADELGHLDRITEARAAIAEAEMISSDMLPSTQS